MEKLQKDLEVVRATYSKAKQELQNSREKSGNLSRQKLNCGRVTEKWNAGTAQNQ
jgi:hypothetical protein